MSLQKARIFSFVFVFFILFFFFTISSGESKYVLNEKKAANDDPFITYLPLINNKACMLNDSYVSPFSLQIAALHQVQSLSFSSQVENQISKDTTKQDMAMFDAAFPSLLTALHESGAGWTRLYIKWSEIEPQAPLTGQEPVYNWTWYDPKLKLISQSGVHIIATVADAPAWAAPTACSPFTGASSVEFARFLGDLVRHYSISPYQIKHWEIINEPDNTWQDGYLGGLGCWGANGSDYSAMLQLANASIKTADPDATVLMGGVAHDWFSDAGGRFYRYFPDDLMNSGGGANFDIFNFHYFPDFHKEWERWDVTSQDRQYGWLPAPTCGNVFDGIGDSYSANGIDVIAKINHFRNRMATCFASQKPLWITELAEHGYQNNPASLTQQAVYVIKGNVRALSAGVGNITWYALATPNDSYQQGLLYDDWTPKPAFYAYKTLTSELKYYTYAATLNQYGIEGYVFKDGCGTEKIVAWGTGSLKFQNTTRVRVVDRMGQEKIILDGDASDTDGVINGSVQVGVSDEPLFIDMSI
jgi:hypothetical protein